MKTMTNVAIELTGTNGSIVMPCQPLQAPRFIPANATTVSFGTGVGMPGHVAGNGVHTGDVTRARDAKQASPPRGPSR